MQYRVKVRVSGVLRVEADSPEQAERMAREAPVRMAGCKLFGEELGVVEAERLGWWRQQLLRLLLWCGLGDPRVRSQVLGLVENHTLQPDNLRTTQSLDES